MPNKKVIVTSRPECDFCSKPAKYDFKTKMGLWANGCEEHYLNHRAYKELGLGKGQFLELDKKSQDSEG